MKSLNLFSRENKKILIHRLLNLRLAKINIQFFGIDIA